MTEDMIPAAGTPCERAFERSDGEYLVSSDRARLDFDAVSAMLSRSYWASTRTPEVMRRSIENSLCFGVYRRASRDSVRQEGNAGTVAEATGWQQAGFARVVTDYATFAWLCDVFVAEEHRGHGLGKRLVETALAHPELRGLRRWMLATADAHTLYGQFGFVALASPERWMERFSP